VGYALAESGESVPPVRDQAMLKECGACHIVSLANAGGSLLA
jgi:hypothetical protein